ncbi:MAG: hypothetical protein GX802_07730 [Clostridiales bacterium]|jgi:hypothetical protein|nr:hypothetical protein [Clostridiales bacterium]
MKTIVCDARSNVTHGIDSGNFVTQVPAEFLAQGRVCIYNEEVKMYIVE